MTASDPKRTEAWLAARADMPPALYAQLEEAERAERSDEYADEPPRWVQAWLALGSRGPSRHPLRAGDWVQLVDEKRQFPPSGRVAGWTKAGSAPGRWRLQVVWSEGQLIKHTKLHSARELTHMNKERVGMLWDLEIYPYRIKEQTRQLDELLYGLYGSDGAPE
ncbi:hypothetical protein AB0393_27980 [Streptomyces cyaneofuscatus]|uniref:hypothetical protein n=1 Tax=Streptomyces cyaneofuscatus TaxID=66883 RepID=UPI00344EF565